MSSDSFKPESEVDESETTILQAEDGDAWDAAERAVLDSQDDLDEGVEEDEPISADEDEEAALEGEVSEPDEDDSEQEGAVSEDKPKVEEPWDGNPDTLPEDLKGKYKDMERHFHQRNAEMSAKMRELDARLAQARAAEAEARGGKRGAEGAEGNVQDVPPPYPTGDDDEATFVQKMDARFKWFGEKALKDAIASGEVITREQFDPIKIESESAKVKAKLAQHPDYSDEIGNRMADIAMTAANAGDYRHMAKLNSMEGLMDLMDIAKESIRAEKAEAAAAAIEASRAAKVADNTRKTAAAAKKSVSRPGGSPARGQSFTVPRGATAEDRFEIAKRAALGDG